MPEFKTQMIDFGDQRPQERLVGITPTVVIGLGGTGKGVVMSLRRQFYERYGVASFPMIGHLVIDSDAIDSQKNFGGAIGGDMHAELLLKEKGFPPEFVNCMLGEDGYNYYFEDKDKEAFPHIFSWIDQTMTQYDSGAVCDGCGQHRPFGRLSFFYKFAEIRAAIQGQIKHVIEAAADARNGDGWAPPNTNATTDPSRLEVILVHSIAGGTGAGMFLDVAYLVRAIIDDFAKKKPLKSHVCDIAVLPGMMEGLLRNNLPGQWDKVRANSYACLLEMEHYSMRRWDRYSFLANRSDAKGEPEDLGGNNEFEAIWDPGDSEFGKIKRRGAPWHTCFLVDNSNRGHRAGLSAKELFEMIGEYLMLDFEPTDFGTEKRSLRSNAVNQLTRDYAEHVPNDIRPIYSNIYSCRFSTFGVAQIYVDQDRLRRAMAQRMGARVIRRDIGGEKETEEVRDRSDADFSRPFSNSRHSNLLITRSYTLEYVEGTDLAAARTFYQNQTKADNLGVADLQQAAAKVLAKLPPKSDPGERSHTTNMISRAKKMRTQLSERLEDMADAAFREWGATGTIQLLERYVDKLDELATQLTAVARQVPVSMAAILQEVSDYEKETKKMMGEVAHLWHRQKVATQIINDMRLPGQAEKMRTARRFVFEKHIEPQYHARAAEVMAEHISALARRVRELMLPYFRHACDLLEKLEDEFLRKFEEGKQAPIATRNFSLWEPTTEREYDAELEKKLPKMPQEDPDIDPPVDWAEVARRVYNLLKSLPEEEYAKYRTYDDSLTTIKKLVPPYDQKMPLREQLKAFADATSRACYDVIPRHELNAIDFLMEHNLSESDLIAAIGRLQERSDPYLLRNENSPVAREVSRVQLLSLAHPDPERVQQFLGLVRAEGMNIKEPLAGEPDSIVCFQQLTGLPLALYTDLHEMAKCYEKFTQQHSHINYRATKLYLPDIEPVEPDVYNIIKNHTHEILFAVMTGSIVMKEENVFTLVVQFGLDARDVPLASSLDRMIKEVAKNERYLRAVQQASEKWFVEADLLDPEDKARLMATMLVGVQQLLEATEEAITFPGAHSKMANPIHHCAVQIAEDITSRMKSDAGEKYHDHYDIHSPSSRDDADIRDGRQRCFRPAHRFFPIPVHVKNELVKKL